MGKGDKKSKKGKISMGSYGNSRKRKARKDKLKRSVSAKAVTAAVVVEPEVKPKRAAAKKKTDA